MRPNLETILKATLKACGMSHKDYEILKYTKTHSVSRVNQFISLIAYEYGYSILNIAAYLGREKSTIRHHINQARGFCDIYADIRELVQNIKKNLSYEHTHICYGYIARSYSGLLVISPKLPERCGGYWIGEGTKPYVNQRAFPQVNWSSEPVKVKIKVTIEEDETM